MHEGTDHAEYEKSRKHQITHDDGVWKIAGVYIHESAIYDVVREHQYCARSATPINPVCEREQNRGVYEVEPGKSQFSR